MAEFPSTGKVAHHLRREDNRVYRLNTTRLDDVMWRHGDKTPYAFAKRTGINVSSAYRIHSGETQPDLINALRIADAYSLNIRTLMDRVDDEAEEDEPAGAAA